MTSLEDIALEGCAGLSDAGLAHLVRLPRLKKLSVDAAGGVTRAGITVFPAQVEVHFFTLNP